jgi:hypothetical protein
MEKPDGTGYTVILNLLDLKDPLERLGEIA